MRTPREKFIASEHCADFKALVQKGSFEEATMAALLEMQTEMPLHCTPNEAADAHNKMSGARRYAEILCSLWVPDAPAKPKPKAGLDYSFGV